MTATPSTAKYVSKSTPKAAPIGACTLCGKKGCGYTMTSSPPYICYSFCAIAGFPGLFHARSGPRKEVGKQCHHYQK